MAALGLAVGRETRSAEVPADELHKGGIPHRSAVLRDKFVLEVRNAGTLQPPSVHRNTAAPDVGAVVAGMTGDAGDAVVCWARVLSSAGTEPVLVDAGTGPVPVDPVDLEQHTQRLDTAAGVDEESGPDDPGPGRRLDN